MNLNTRPSECVKLYADSLRKSIRLLTKVEKLEIRKKSLEGLEGIERHKVALDNLRIKITKEGLEKLEKTGKIKKIPSYFN